MPTFNYSGPVEVQSAIVGSGAQNTTDLVLAAPASITVGNLLIVSLAWSAVHVPANLSILDALGNPLTLIGSLLSIGGSSGAAAYYAPNCLGGADSFTFHSTSNLWKGLSFVEVPGLPSTALDVTTQATGTGTLLASGAITPSAAGNYLFAMSFDETANQLHSCGVGWKSIQQHDLGSTDVNLDCASQVAINTNAISSAFKVFNTAAFGSLIASFKNMGPAASGGGLLTHPGMAGRMAG